MNILKVAALVLAMVIPTFAAKAADGPEKHFSVRIDYDLSTAPKPLKIGTWASGVGVGATYYAPLGGIWFFHAGLMIVHDRIGLDGYTGNKYTRRKLVGDIAVTGFKFPLAGGIRLLTTDKLMLSFYTGPQMYFNFWLKANYDEMYAGAVIPTEHKMTNSAMDIGWMAGIGLDFASHWNVHAESYYPFSNLCMAQNIEVGHLSHFTRAGLTFGISYAF